ncbi:MAG: hypothetical protein M5U19_00735 [Microthrixaceae bacterium]|nr:hypothetical protein [Microthrixaceae bacterium]
MTLVLIWVLMWFPVLVLLSVGRRCRSPRLFSTRAMWVPAVLCSLVVFLAG